MEGQALRVGASIVSHLSNAFYEDASRAFEEYVINSSDALAEHVKVKITPTLVEIEDDGEGMTAEELQQFFYISHSLKVAGETRDLAVGKDKRVIKRQVIGQFGLGKLSAYKFADTISIITWKNGIESSASLSFSDLMSKKYIEDLVLQVVSKEASDPKKHGTLVRMTKLKQLVYARTVAKRLSDTLPFHPDLTVSVNDEILKAATVKGKVIRIDDDDSRLGRIYGTIVYTDQPHYKEAGIHIRVFGRVVNLNPRLVNAMMNVTGAMSLSQRTFVDVNIDSLAPALLAHRNGFDEDNSLVQDVERWMKTKLNYENAVYLKSRKADTEKLQEAKAIVTVSSRLSANRAQFQKDPKSSRFLFERKRISDRAAALREAVDIIAKKDTLSLEFKGKTFIFDLVPLGREGTTWTFDDSKRTVRINSDHPLYQEAKGRNASDLYALATAIVAVVLETSRNLAEFRANYDELARIATKT